MSGVYLASAIDQDHEDIALLEYIACDLNTVFDWVFDPGQAFRVAPNPNRDSSIRDINRVALETADALVAVLPAGRVSIGVPMEIDRAVSAGKPTIVISDAPSWMLAVGMPGEFDSLTRPLRVVGKWDATALGWLRRAIDGISERTTAPQRLPMPITVSEGAGGLRRGYDDDAGLDLVVSRLAVINPGEFRDIPCGVSVQLPEWAFGMITGRSSTLRKRGLLVNQGIIDAGWRGELFAGVWNLGDTQVVIQPGERVAQLLVLDNGTRRIEPVTVASLDEGSRGHNGFGSTGA